MQNSKTSHDEAYNLNIHHHLYHWC